VAPNTHAVPPTRRRSSVDLALGVIAFASAILGLIAFIAVIAATTAGLPAAQWSTPLWIIIMTTAYWGLPICLAAVIALVIRKAVMSRNANRARTASAPDQAPEHTGAATS